MLSNSYTPPGGVGGCPGKSGLKGFLRKKSGLKEIKGFGKETKEISPPQAGNFSLWTVVLLAFRV